MALHELCGMSASTSPQSATEGMSSPQRECSHHRGSVVPTTVPLSPPPQTLCHGHSRVLNQVVPPQSPCHANNNIIIHRCYMALSGDRCRNTVSDDPQQGRHVRGSRGVANGARIHCGDKIIYSNSCDLSIAFNNDSDNRQEKTE